MTDFDGQKYDAIYDRFKVMSFQYDKHKQWINERPNLIMKPQWYRGQGMMMIQVGPAADGYPLTVGGFNDALSTLGDSMTYNNGMKFSTK